MSVNIKTADLCERCVYGFDRYCTEHGCNGCARSVDGKCKCIDIRENTTCPYFEEEDDNGKADD